MTDRLTVALDALVERGVLDSTQAGAVATEFAAQPEPVRPEGLRGRLGEIAGYLGASLVLGGTVLFLGENWEEFGRAGRVSALVAVAAILLGCGVAVSRRAAAVGDQVRRRLSSTLLTGAAVAGGFAAYAGLENWAAACGTTLALAVAGYLIARSAVGLLAAAGAACGAYSDVLNRLDAESTVSIGVGLLVMGALWAVLARYVLVAERRVALLIAVVLGLSGAQIMILGDDNALCYILTALVAGACFAAYLSSREWMLLAGGVIGATLVVPEFLYDVTDGSLGASGTMLVAGLTLLAGGLMGLRLRGKRDVVAL